MTRLTTRQRRNHRRRRPRPRIHWQHVLSFALVVFLTTTWAIYIAIRFC